MRRWQVLGCVGMLLAAPAWAQAPYVALEQRLDPQALAEVGLTPAQLQALNRLLRQAEAEAAAPAPPRPPGGAPGVFGPLNPPGAKGGRAPPPRRPRPMP
ncbi:MAG: hypothetical protein K0M59_04875, partial [Stenotrophomonas sp.]|nr:hypothetical protein [Stenotrophomonas sp.]